MDFKQLEAYVKVIEYASFSKAAEAIFMSQPSVSTYISALEKELATTLINRSTKEVSPTPAGKYFYEKAKELLSLKHNTLQGIKNFTVNLVGKISIIASSVPAQYMLPEILARFTHMHPGISFAIKQADTLEVCRSIAAQKAEIGFAGGATDTTKCAFKELMTERMVIIAPHDKGLTSATRYSLDKLLYEHPFIGRELGSGTKAQYETFFTQQGINLKKINVCFSFDNTQSIINAVASGLGISMVSEFAAKVFIDQKMIIPLKLTTMLPERKFYYVLKKNYTNSHLVNVFEKFLTQLHV